MVDSWWYFQASQNKYVKIIVMILYLSKLTTNLYPCQEQKQLFWGIIYLLICNDSILASFDKHLLIR